MVDSDGVMRAPELRAELGAARQQVGGVGKRGEQWGWEADVIDVSAKAENPVAVVEVGGVAVVEAGECKVASHTTKFDVIFALEAAEFG